MGAATAAARSDREAMSAASGKAATI